MDSVTQFALGATVGIVALGPKIGPRKAAVIGGLMGTVPDLDTFIPITDPVESFIAHRGPSHSLIVQALATPFFAEPLVRVFKDLHDSRIRTYAAIYLMFATHALIDAMTVYGTKLLWPLSDHPFGVGSVFIIDPVYTLPLLILTLAAFFIGTWRARFGKWCWGALCVSTAYMLATIPMQASVAARAEAILAQQGIAPERLIAIPTPFNTLYWQAIAVTPTRHINMYLPLFGGASNATVYAYDRRPDLHGCMSEIVAFQELQTFTKGFYRLHENDGRIVFNDLRMGLAPNYVFRFALAQNTDTGLSPIDPPIRLPNNRKADGDLPWLMAGITGEQTPRPAEIAYRTTLPALSDDIRLAALSPCGIIG